MANLAAPSTRQTKLNVAMFHPAQIMRYWRLKNTALSWDGTCRLKE
jgi:hypothetical protein